MRNWRYNEDISRDKDGIKSVPALKDMQYALRVERKTLSSALPIILNNIASISTAFVRREEIFTGTM